jgi:hypothetical protein
MFVVSAEGCSRSTSYLYYFIGLCRNEAVYGMVIIFTLLQYNSSAKDMESSMSSIVDMLWDTCQKVYVLTIPPIPRHDISRDHAAWSRLLAYNKFLKEGLKGIKSSCRL